MLGPTRRKQLGITLTEPVIFLRSSDPSGRLQSDPNDSPTLVRGILTLNVVKPIEISSIEVELTGVMTVNSPESVGARYTDVPEKHKIYSSAVTVFRADQIPRGKRPASAGPGLSAAISNTDDEHAATSLSRPLSSSRGSGRQSTVPPDAVPDLGPTPPYTPVAQPPTLVQPRVGALGENPAQTLEQLRQALRFDIDGQSYRNALRGQPLPPRHSIALSLPNPTPDSNASIVSDESLYRDDDSNTSLPSTGDASFYNAMEESPRILPHRGPSPGRASRSYSPENTHGSQPRGNDASNPPAGRSRLRLSLGTVLDAVMEVTSRAPSRSRGIAGPKERERGRTRVRVIAEEPSTESTQVGEDTASTENGSQLAANACHRSGHAEHREEYRPSRVLSWQRDHVKDKDIQQKFKEQGKSWREFKPGTYSYPISFLLPPNLPPTFSVRRGSLDYIIKGVAHRPGSFTSKLSCHVPLLVVAAPTAGAGEGGAPGDLGPVFFQKQWEGKLAYHFALSTRLFLLGSQHHLEAATSDGIHANVEPSVGAPDAEAAYGTAILDLTLLPFEKMKIWTLSVVVDQHIRYLDGRRKILRDEDNARVSLLEVQDACPAEDMDLVGEQESTHKNRHRLAPIPLLPTPLSPHRSPLLRYISPSADPSILAGPGPYTLSVCIGLPGCTDPLGCGRGLKFTVKHNISIVRVEHSLRLVMRVQRIGDEGIHDHEEGEDRKKQFDITVQAPITILSCRCVPEYQTLPRYSPTTEDGMWNRTACPCQPSTVGALLAHGQGHDVGHPPSSASSSFEDEDGTNAQLVHQRSRSSSRARRRDHSSPFTTPLHPPTPPLTSRAGEAGWGRPPVHAQTRAHGQHHHAHAQSQATPASTPHSSRPPSPPARYERLVSGLESEAGEAPPSYDSISSRFR